MSHLDLDALADVVAGERDRPAHLDGCALCRAALADVAGAQEPVRGLLAALPDPPLPADLAARLDAALAAQAAGRPVAVAGPGAAAARDARRPPRAGASWLTAAAAAAVLAVGGGLGYAAFSSGAGVEDTAAGSAAPVAAPAPETRSGTDYADPAAVTAALPGVLAGTAAGGAVAQAPDQTTATEEDSGDSAASGLAESERALLPPAGDVVASDAAEDPLARLRDPAALASCLAAVLTPEQRAEVLALDHAQYAGEPALAVLVPAPGRPQEVDVYVVGAGCREGDDQVLGFRRVPRP